MNEATNPQEQEQQQPALEPEITTISADDDGLRQPEGEPEGQQGQEDGQDSGEGEEGQGQQRPKVEFTPEQQEFINTEIVGKKVAKIHEWQNRAEKAEREAQELRRYAPKDERPVVPDPPNPYAPDYEKLVKERDEALAKQIRWDAEQRHRSEQALQKQQEHQNAVINAHVARVQTYAQRATDSGIQPETLQQAGAVVENFIQDQLVTNHILEDDQGPGITMYLAKNPAEAQKISSMTPNRAVIYINETIRPRVVRNSKPKDPPPEVIRGKGAQESQPGPKGATFENYN